MRVLAFCLIAAALAGCGFAPMYGDRGVSSSPGVEAELAQISVAPLNDRQGMRMRQILRDELEPAGAPTAPAYELVVTLTSRVEESGIRKDATSSRANFILSASYYLTKSRARVYGDRIESIVSYNILNDQYATVAAQADAQERALKEIAAEMKTRLSIYFTKQLKTTASAAH